MARVGRLVLVLVGALLVGVAVVALVAPRPPFTPYRQPVVIGATLAFLLVGVLWRPPTRVRRVLRTWWVPWLVAVAGGWLAVVVGTSLRIVWSWDVGVVNGIALKLHTGVPLAPSQVAYLSRYPNTHPLVGIHRSAFEVSDSTGWSPHTVLVTLVAVAAGLSVLLVYPLVAPVSGRVRAVAAQLVVIALVAVSPWVAVPYTDVLAMPLLTGSVVLVLRAARRFDWWSVPLLLASAVLAAGAVVAQGHAGGTHRCRRGRGPAAHHRPAAPLEARVGGPRGHGGLGRRDAGARRPRSLPPPRRRWAGSAPPGLRPDAAAPVIVVARERHDDRGQPGAAGFGTAATTPS